MGRLVRRFHACRTRRLSWLGFLAALHLSATGTTTVAAQGAFDKVPTRPRLPADRDTNSAIAYYNYGVSVLGLQPDKAAAAFYWASRLDPSWAAPLYGQHAALLLAQPHSVLTGYLTRRDIAVRDPTIRRIDSLAYLALLKNPFVDRRLEGVILTTWLGRETNGTADVRDFGMYDRRFTAWAAYARGDFKMAATVYGEAVRRHPRDPDLRFWHALSFFALGLIDSARTAVQEALAIERGAESESPTGWVSQAFAEYSVGLLFELGGQQDSARAAYERALLDDIAFHPAHRQLGRARLSARDTAGALSEYVQAASLAPGDAGYLYDLGMLLLATGQPDSGTAALLRATAAEPFYALPHYPLGVVNERSGFAKEAAEHFTTFLRLAPRSMGPAIGAARERLAALKAEAPGP